MTRFYRSPDSHLSATPVCPLCSGLNMGRTIRRPFDHLISLAIPVRRYRCKGCGWTGNLVVSKISRH
jgi:hypothetical protein